MPQNQKYNPKIHHRKSIRLINYDYSDPGAYFVTICTQNRVCIFGNIDNCQMKLNEYGRIVHECVKNTCNHFPQINLDCFVIMPNHFHSIIVINDICIRAGEPRPDNNDQHDQSLQIINIASHKNHAKYTNKIIHANITELHNPVRAGSPRPQNNTGNSAQSLGQIIAYFKYQSTKQINSIHKTDIKKTWQRNYYEHIIRNNIALNRIQQYISNNPSSWKSDKFHKNNNLVLS